MADISDADIVGTQGAVFTLTLDKGSSINRATMNGTSFTVSGLTIKVPSLPGGGASISLDVTPSPGDISANVFVASCASGLAVAAPVFGQIHFDGPTPGVGAVDVFGVTSGIVATGGAAFTLSIDAGTIASAICPDGTQLTIAADKKSIGVANLEWGPSSIEITLSAGSPAANITLGTVTSGKALAGPGSLAIPAAGSLEIVTYGGQL